MRGEEEGYIPSVGVSGPEASLPGEPPKVEAGEGTTGEGLADAPLMEGVVVAMEAIVKSVVLKKECECRSLETKESVGVQWVREDFVEPRGSIFGCEMPQFMVCCGELAAVAGRIFIV